MATVTEITAAARRAAKPSEAQADAGNYRTAHIRIHGLDVTIETPRGRHRRPEWPPMAAHYGYIKRTAGADGDHVDVFIGPCPESELVVVVDQLNAKGGFDEHKCLIAFRTTADAIDCYRKCYTPGWNVGPTTTMTMDQFKSWLADGSQSKPIAPQVSRYAAEFASVIVDRLSPRPQTVAERFGAMLSEFLIERYAKNSPGQLSLFADGLGNRTLRRPERQQRLNWDESKHPRDPEGKFAEKGSGSTGAKPKGPKKPFVYPNGETQQIGDDGKPDGTPAEPPQDPPKPKPPVDDPKGGDDKPEAKPVDLFGDEDKADEGRADETPRERAERQQREDDPEYEFARKSAVPNAGEDLKGSARHNVNQWRTLEQAEEDGTAAELVTRDQLLKNEPHELSSHVEKAPITALLMHEALRSFPPRPGYGKRIPDAETQKKDRKDYVDAYRNLKATAEKIAASGEENPVTAARTLAEKVRSEILRLRGQRGDGLVGHMEATDKYNNTANALTGLYKSLANPRMKSSTVRKVGEFSLELGAKAKEEGKSLRDAVIAGVLDVMEGKTMGAVLGRKGKAKGDTFDAAAMYVAHATREGGPKSPATTAREANAFLVEKAGFRGVQYGNSVSDKEREHHATMAAAAMVDLADITGLPVDAIGLNGKLGLAIGARGRANALAHYEPGTKVINLTRKKGVGSLAHEWAHALDHELAGGSPPEMNSRGKADVRYHSEDGGITRTGKVVDGKWKSTFEDRTGEPKFKAMDGLRKAMASSGFDKRLPEAMRDKGIVGAKRSYWTSPREKFARCFERFAQRKLEKAGRKNTYLAGIESKAYKQGGLWPTDEEVDHMAPHFEALLAAHRKDAHGLDEPIKYSASDRQLFIDRLSARILGITVEQYAARRLKYSPGQQGLFDEEKHPRDGDGKFAEKNAANSKLAAAKANWDDVPSEGRDAFEKNAIEPLRDKVARLDELAKNPMLGPRYAWESAVKGGEKPGDPHGAEAFIDRWKKHASKEGHDGDALVDSHPELNDLIKRLDSHRSWGYEPTGKGAAEPAKGIEVEALKNDDAKKGDQLGMFGEATRAPRKQADFGGSKAKQANLIDGLSAKAGQMSLIDEAGAPEDMVYKPDSVAGRYAARWSVSIDRYRKSAEPRAPLPKSKKSKATEAPKIVTGKHGDRGYYVTIDGHPVFIGKEGRINRGPRHLKGKQDLDFDDSVKTKRTRGPKSQRSDVFVPKTRVDHAIVEAIGAHPDDVKAFRGYMDDAHKLLATEARETNESLRELLSHFGYNGKQIPGFLAAARRYRDTSNIGRFDEMVEYAKAHMPHILAGQAGESVGADDAEYALFERLRNGFEDVPTKDSVEVVDLALDMAGPSFLEGVESGERPEAIEDDEWDAVPFSARLHAVRMQRLASVG